MRVLPNRDGEKPRSSEAQRVVIYGTRGVAREFLQVIRELALAGCAIQCEGFLVDEAYRDCATVKGLPVFGNAGWLATRPELRAVIGIGATAPRYRIASEIARNGGQFAQLVHPRAALGESVKVGMGTVVGALAVATTDICVGDHAQIHAASTIGHDTVISDFVTVAPGANISGRVEIGAGAFVGAGAVVLPDVRVGCWSIIGAGAVVTEDVGDNVTVAGVPARVISRRQPGWHLTI